MVTAMNNEQILKSVASSFALEDLPFTEEMFQKGMALPNNEVDIDVLIKETKNKYMTLNKQNEGHRL